MESTVIVIAIFAAIIIVVALVFRGSIRTVIKGPGSTGLKVEASNPLPRPGVKIEDAQSRHGGLRATDHAGQGVDVSKIKVDKDIEAVNALLQEQSHPKVPPPA